MDMNSRKLQEIVKDREAWSSPQGPKELDKTERLNNNNTLCSTGSQDSDTTEVTEHEIKEDEGKIERKTREKRRRKQTQLWSHQTRLEIVRAEAAAAGALVAGIY